MTTVSSSTTRDTIYRDAKENPTTTKNTNLTQPPFLTTVPKNKTKELISYQKPIDQ